MTLSVELIVVKLFWTLELLWTVLGLPHFKYFEIFEHENICRELANYRDAIVTFTDGSIHQDIEPVALLKKTVKYEGPTQEVTYSYSDASLVVKKFQAVNQLESWSADHEIKTIKYSFQDGSSSKKVERIEPRLQAVRYAGDKKIISMRYGDGFIKDLTQQAASKEVTWSEDKRTKLTKYKFADGSTHSDEVRVDAILVKTEYDKDVEVNTFKLGDGSLETKRVKAISKLEEWERDHVTKRTNFKFPSGKINTIKTVEKPTSNRRMLGSVNFNGLAQRGEQFGIQAMHSQGADYARLAYSEPIGPYGWRIGASASEMKYQVISSDMLALNAHGPASTRGVEMMVPIVRGRDGNHSLQMTADDKKFRNETYAGTYSRYSANVYGVNLQGTQSDELGWGGLTTYGLSWTSGRFDLNGSPNENDDLNGAQIAGKFNKYKLSLKREQQLTRSTTLSLSYQSQWADKNLDSSEKIFLGGAQGVRAYAANEAGGTQGQLLNLELQHQIQLADGVFTQAVFYDVGEITVNKNNNFATALPLNSYSLKGAGIWAGWNLRNKLGMAYARLTWARRIGVNPAANLLGLDQDGTLIRDRWWLTLNQSF